MKREKRSKGRADIALALLAIAELAIVAYLLLFSSYKTDAVVGADQVTVSTNLTVGNAFPEVINVTINNNNAIDLTPNSTTTVVVVAIVRDFNGDNDISAVTAEFFDNAASFYGDADDNNYHYTNSTCAIDTTYGDSFEANATCTFEVWYYANNATWNATVFVNDSINTNGTGSNTQTINTLLALGLPDSIDYGVVNATFVSDERLANVTNFGNVMFNLSLTGYAVTSGDGYAMNCSLGSVQNISIEYEKYNVTASNPGSLTLAQFDSLYRNLTSSSVVNTFNLNYRTNDTDVNTDEVNTTYWRIYVPPGVAGTCTGNIVFGAVQAAGT
ncbi:hypothetical protein D6817_00030 [Candidatus Pacearchaeota archaeon]|nr:MAG: hypothetical protein D6817_00030 [Candidatus Pacearchaeota archaeon]